jgi:threonine synthase
MEAITGARPALPPRLASLMTDPERYEVLPAELAVIERHVEQRVRTSEEAAK